MRCHALLVDLEELPGLSYLSEIDVLCVKLFSGINIPVELTGQRMEFPDLGLFVDGQWGSDDHRLRMLLFHPASRRVPPAVLKAAPGSPLALGFASDEPGTLVLPFFPEAMQVARHRVALHLPDDRPPISISLAKSRRVVGLLVPDARNRLDPDFVAGIPG